MMDTIESLAEQLFSETNRALPGMREYIYEQLANDTSDASADLLVRALREEEDELFFAVQYSVGVRVGLTPRIARLLVDQWNADRSSKFTLRLLRVLEQRSVHDLGDAVLSLPPDLRARLALRG